MTSSTILIATVRSRTRDFLVDAGSLVWADGTIDEGIRQALGDLGRAVQGKLTINGLDGAGSTGMDVLSEELLIRGAAGYAARSRAMDRAEMANLNQGTAPGLAEWGKVQLEWFYAQVLLTNLTYVADMLRKGAIETAQAALLNAEADNQSAQGSATNAKSAMEQQLYNDAETARLAKEIVDTGLQRSTSPTHSPMEWDESEKGW